MTPGKGEIVFNLADFAALVATKQEILKSYNELHATGLDHDEIKAIFAGIENKGVLPLIYLWLDRHARLP